MRTTETEKFPKSYMKNEKLKVKSAKGGIVRQNPNF